MVEGEGDDIAATDVSESGELLVKKVKKQFVLYEWKWFFWTYEGVAPYLWYCVVVRWLCVACCTLCICYMVGTTTSRCRLLARWP